MTGGTAYVLDESEGLERRFNPTLITLHPVDDPADAARLRDLVAAHRETTGSTRAREILEDWDRWIPLFRKVVPREAPTSASTHAPKGRSERR
jgi:glutamate synthase domain-containing protein 3